MTVTRRVAIVMMCAVLTGGVLAGTIGCEPKPSLEEEFVGSVDATRSFDNAVKQPPPAFTPPPPMLTEPQTAVYSYLLWISYAYRILDSDVATHTFSPYEEVRVNSYVQYNKQEARAIDQVLTDFQITDVAGADEQTATVSVVETWKYRYIDARKREYKGDWQAVTYDSTYTVVFDEGKGRWLVDDVEPTARGEVN